MEQDLDYYFKKNIHLMSIFCFL